MPIAIQRRAQLERKTKEKVCPQCSKTFTIAFGQWDRKYCSPACRRQSRLKSFCPECGTYQGKPNTKYCGPKCQSNALAKRCKPVKIRHCKHCQAPYEQSWRKANRGYCSLKCFHQATNGWNEIKCDQCGCSFKRRNCARKFENSYCSTECARIATASRMKKALSRIGVRGIEKTSEWRSATTYIRNRCQDSCEACGGKSNCKKKIPVDHIIPRRLMLLWNYPADAIENLVGLCISCHSKKTSIENKLLKGDLIGFISDLKKMNYPMERVRNIFVQVGLSTKMLERENETFKSSIPTGFSPEPDCGPWIN